MVNLPNLLTLVRLLLAPFVAWAILSRNYGQAILLFFFAGVSDALDGYLARRLSKSTPIGAFFDPIVDKVLLSVIYISLGAARAIPWWMVYVVLGRDGLILAMAVSALLFTPFRSFPPSALGKISTFLQIAAALVVMGSNYGIPAPVEFALWLMVVGTVVSGFHYAWRGVTMLRAKMN